MLYDAVIKRMLQIVNGNLKPSGITCRDCHSTVAKHISKEHPNDIIVFYGAPFTGNKTLIYHSALFRDGKRIFDSFGNKLVETLPNGDTTYEIAGKQITYKVSTTITVKSLLTSSLLSELLLYI